MSHLIFMSWSLDTSSAYERHFWPMRSILRNRLMFGKTPEEAGLEWYEYQYMARDRLRSHLLIVNGEISTHNHFVLHQSDYLFNRTTPVIKLPDTAGERDYLSVLAFA